MGNFHQLIDRKTIVQRAKPVPLHFIKPESELRIMDELDEFTAHQVKSVLRKGEVIRGKFTEGNFDELGDAATKITWKIEEMWELAEVFMSTADSEYVVEFIKECIEEIKEIEDMADDVVRAKYNAKDAAVRWEAKSKRR